MLGHADAPSTPQRRPRNAPRSAALRSAVANGKRLIANADTHSREYREYRDIVVDLIDHLGSDATVVQRAIAEEAAGLVVWCRNARLELLNGDTGFDITRYTTATNALRRLLADIGQERRLKDITPDLNDYLARKSKDGAT